MTDLKWLVVAVAVGYLGGLVAVFLMQRAFLFPIPQTVRTAPDAAGFPEADEQVLTTADGQRVVKLILEAPYSSIADIAAASLLRVMPVRWLLRDQFHSDERIARITAPLLIMHGGRDSTIPIAFGERLFALAREPKQFV